MKSKKVLIFCLVAVLALSLMGFGFAKWSDTVTFEGKVATGNIGVKIVPVGTNDCGEKADPQYGKGKNKEGKNVAKCEIKESKDGKNITLNICNAYSWYAPEFAFKIYSTGSVPVKLEDIEKTDWSGELGKFIKMRYWKIEVLNHKTGNISKFEKYGEHATWDKLIANLKNIQLHEKGYIKVTIGMYIDQKIKEKDGCGYKEIHCPQNRNSKCTITFKFSQWNEVYGEQPKWIK